MPDSRLLNFPEIRLKDFPNIFSLNGKVAVVTGGSRGLGLSAAAGLIHAGCAKVFITSRKRDACENACRALNTLPSQYKTVAIPIPADVTSSEDLQMLVDQIGQFVDHVDILVANAGITWGEAFDRHPDAAFERVLNVNVKSVFVLIQKLMPLLEKRATLTDPSRIIATSSVAGISVGLLGNHGTYGYSASKAALIHLMRNLAVELGPRKILCNSIAPGLFPSKMSRGVIKALSKSLDPSDRSPNGRIGQPDDIAGTVVYLASRASSHMNGECLVLDGGVRWSSSRL